MAKTDADAIRQYFTQLGNELHHTLHIDVGGSCALILPGYVSRFTEDIDVVGEVPAEIRSQHQLLDNLEKLHGLHLGHVQPHYFPQGWQNRTHSFGVYRCLQVSLVDVYDVFLSKLFSARMKDIADLKELLQQLEKETLVRRLTTTCGPFLTDARLKELAAKNWTVLFGEDLPS